MRPSPTWFNRARRILSLHVEQLGDRLLAITERLRETVALAVAQTVAGAVREGVCVVLADIRAGPSAPQYPPLHSPSSGFWQGYGRPSQDEDRDLHGPLLERWQDDEPDDWDDERAPHETPVRCNPSHQARWHNALAIGCQATAWWLRRTLGRCSALMAFGVGFLCTGAAYAVGAGVAASALGLIVLTDVLQSSVLLVSLICPPGSW